MTSRFSNMIGMMNTYIKQGLLHIKASVNKLATNCLHFFKSQGYIWGYSYTIGGKKLYPRCRIFFKYTDKHMPIIKTLKVFKHTPSNYTMTSKTNLKKDSSGRACFSKTIRRNISLLACFTSIFKCVLKKALNALNKNIIPNNPMISQSTGITRFFGLAFIMQINETNDPALIASYFPMVCVISICFLLFSLLLSWCTKRGYITKTKILAYILNHSFLKFLFIRYCYFILLTKKIFHEESYGLCLGIAIPPISYIVEIVTNNIYFWGHIWNLIAFYFSLSVLLCGFDEASVNICNELKDNPKSQFSMCLNAYLDKKKPLYLERGFWTKLGTLTATGQAAFYAGAFACVTGVATVGINTAYNIQRDGRQADQADKDRTARTAKEDADRTAQATERDKDRTAQAAKDAAAFAYKEKKRAANEKKRTNDYEEAERARQHDRDKWAHEEKMKNKPKSWWPPFSK